MAGKLFDVAVLIIIIALVVGIWKSIKDIPDNFYDKITRRTELCQCIKYKW